MLLFLAVMYTLYFASSLWIPIVIALLVALQLSPLVTFLKRFYIPRPLSAALLLVAIGGPFTFLGMQLVEPAQKWIERVPEVTAKVNEQITSIAKVLVPADQDIPAIVPPQQSDKKSENPGFLAGLMTRRQQPLLCRPQYRSLTRRYPTDWCSAGSRWP